MVSGLLVFPVRREQVQTIAPLYKFNDCVFGKWSLAWGKLDLRYMGRNKWHISNYGEYFE